MTMFTRRCSHYGPWRNGLANSIKISLMLILLSGLFISGNTYGQTASIGQRHSRTTVAPWDQANPQWFVGDQWTNVPLIVNQRLTNSIVTNAPQYNPGQYFGTITIDGDPSDWPAVLNSALNTKKAFKHDPFDTLHIDDQWTGGSSDADAHPNTDWHWINGNSNDKGDIANAGAVLLGTTLYFFGDRTATNGDAQIGFWFFLGDVHPIGDGSVSSGFVGDHTNGDLLIISNFVNGGGHAAPSVYEWQGKTATLPGSPVLVSPIPNADLETNTTTQNVPGGTNGTLMYNGQTWKFHPKAGADGTYPAPLFFEGFVDLANIPGASLCFQSFLLETRNSQSISASLQDLAAGGFSGVPPPPGVTNATVCVDNQPATITSTCTQGTCQWWADSTTSTPLTSGGGVTVNGCSLSVTGFAPGTYTYFASCTDGGCTSARVRGTITITPKPTVVGDVIPSEADNVADDPDGITPVAGDSQCPKQYQLNLLRANVVHFTASGATTLNWAIVNDGNPLDNITFVNSGATATFTINSAVGFSARYKFIVTGTDANGCINTDSVCIVPTAVLPICNLCGPNDVCAAGADQQYCLKSLCTNVDPDALDLTDFDYVWSITNVVGTGSVTFVGTSTNVACVTTHVSGTVTSYTVQLNINGKGPLGINVPPCTKTTTVTCPTPTIGAAGANATIECTASPSFTAPTATDACGGTTVNNLGDQTTGNSCSKTITRSWDATNSCGNHSATVTQSVTIVDTQAPTIGDAGSNHTIDCTASPDFTVPTASDACNGATVNLLTNTTTGNSCNRVFTRTWDATDACGHHSATRTQVITAIDTHAPTIGNAGANATIDCTASPSFTAPTAADDCSGATVNLLSNTSSGNACTLTVFTRTWDATDACGNHSATRTQQITVLGSQAPTIGSPGSNHTIDCTATPDFTAPTASNACGAADVHLLTNTTTGNSCNRVFTRTWDATDACGNHSATVTQVVTAIDTHGPTIGNAGDNATIDCTATPNFTAPTAADDCSGATVNLLTNTTTGNSCNRVFTRTWDATDACGNHSATRTQVITAIDTHGPTIGNAGDNATIDCTATPNFTAPTAADDCNGATVNLLTNTTTGNSCNRVFTRTWDATDACGNHSATRTQVITAIDTHAPTIGSAGGNATIDCTATPNFTAPTAADDCSGATVNLLTNTTTGNSCNRVFTRTWDATDACGNHSATRTQVITAIDTHGPTIGAAGPAATIECPTTPTFTPPTAADDCSGATVNNLGDVTGGTACAKTVTRSWDATDACGNHSATVSQTITITDTQGPTLGSAGADATVDCSVTPTFTPPTASDACGDATVNLLSDITSAGTCAGSFTETRTWDAVDACGNHSSTTASQTISVVCICTTGEGCTPGFWKTHPEIWDGVAPDGVSAGFTTGTNFYTYFNIAPGSCGLPSTLTMLGAVSLGGGQCKAVARQGVAALLNAAAFPDYPFPAGSHDFASLYTLLRNAFLTCTCDSTLIANLNAANSHETDANGNSVCSPLAKLNTIAAFRTYFEATGLSVNAHPNPFTNKVTFRIISPASGKVTLAVYNVTGQRIGIAYEGWIDAGIAKDVEYTAPATAKGMMFYRLVQGDKTVRGKIIRIE